jgi:hypothetical protein
MAATAPGARAKQDRYFRTFRGCYTDGKPI